MILKEVGNRENKYVIHKNKIRDSSRFLKNKGEEAPNFFNSH